MRRSLKKLPENGEKRSKNGENLHIAIMSIYKFIRQNFCHPHKVFLRETLYAELPKNLVICFKRTLASLLLDTTKTQKIEKIVIK